MSKDDTMHAVNRREFIGRMSGGVIAAGLAGSLAGESAAAAAPETKLEKRNEQSGMIYRPFGKTNLNISRLSFGCIRLTDDGLPAMEMAIERGVNLVHISNTYVRRQSIVSLGKFLKNPKNREKVWVALKGENERGLFENIDDQLQILNTDHVDIYCLPVNTPEQIRSERDLERFEALKKAGKVRFYNLTTHKSVPESMAAGVDRGWYSSILAVMGLGAVAQLQPTVQRANKANVGIMAMKTQQGAKGTGPDKIAAGLFAAGVTTILKTLNTREEVDAWFAAVTKAPQEMAELPSDCQVAAAGGLCTLCGICEGCPNGVAVQSIVRDYTYYYQQQEIPEIAAERYGELRVNQTALSCGDCGRCESVCPMGVPVRRIIREAHQRLGAMA